MSKVMQIPTAGERSALTGTAAILEEIEGMTQWFHEQARGYAFQVGERLIALKEQAKNEGIKWGDVCERLPFNRSTAHQLMAIADNSALSSDVLHAKHLPSDWTSLYQLSRIPEPELEKHIEAGRVQPNMSRADAAALARPPPHRTKSTDSEPAPEQEFPASDREVRRENLMHAWQKAAPSDRKWFINQISSWLESHQGDQHGSH